MENFFIYITVGGFIATALIMLIVMHLTKRVKNRLQLALAAGLLVGAGLWVVQMEGIANKKARMTVETLFNLNGEDEILDFDRKASKGTRSQTIEAIYNVSPNGFNTHHNNTLNFTGDISFTYRTGSFEDREIDKFMVTDETLDWSDLPRTYTGKNNFFVTRGHNSHKRTPDEKNMSGKYICVFIKIEAQKAEPQDGYEVIPCKAVRANGWGGIAILGILNDADDTLHVLISSDRVPASGF